MNYDHLLVRKWEGSSWSAAGTLYWAECSCGWETGFKTNVEKIVTDAMKVHAESVQAKATEHSAGGTYV